MQVLHARTGMTFDFPDGTPDEEIQNQFATAQNSMPTQATSLPQQFMQGLQSFQQQQALAPPPVNGRGFVGLDPQQAQFMLQQRQAQQAQAQEYAIEQQRQRLQEQRMNQESIEGEKDRSLRIKLFNEELKNAQAVAKAEADYQKFKLEQEAEGRRVEFDRDKELERLKQQGRVDLLEARIAGQKEVAGIRAAGRGSGGGGGGGKAPDIETIGGRAYIWDPAQAKYIPAPGVEPGAQDKGYLGTGMSPERFLDKVDERVKMEFQSQAENWRDPNKTNETIPQIRKRVTAELIAELTGPQSTPQTAPVIGGPSEQDIAQIGMINRNGGNAQWDYETGEIVIRGN